MRFDGTARLAPSITATLVGALIAAYLVLAVPSLARVPPIHGDEAWQASTAWKLATTGVFGSDLHAGHHNAEHRYYGFMPLHPMLQSLSFRALGLGIGPLRGVSVALTVLVLALTYLLGARLFGRAVGVLGAALLLALPLNATTPYLPTGILMFDVSRLARYDVIVPVLATAALLVYVAARGTAGRRRDALHLASGTLVGLAGLGHLYGVLWLPVLLILAAWDRRGVRAGALLVSGFLVPWLPYAAYVLLHLDEWRGQTRLYADRFRLLDARFYVANLLQEPRRYGPGLGPPGVGWMLRIGFWTALVVLPLALIALLRRSWRGDPSARVLVVPAILLPLLFGLLLRLKIPNYAATLMPVLALIVAWGIVSAWRRLGPAVAGPPAGSRRRTAAGRAALVLLLIAIATEAAGRYAGTAARAAGPGAYEIASACLRASVPERATVVGDHRWWLGLADRPYRAWLVVFARVDEATPPFGDAETMMRELDAIGPDAVLIDAGLRGYFANAPAGDRKPAAVEAWLAGRGYQRRAVTDVAPYGPLEIFVRGPATESRCGSAS